MENSNVYMYIIKPEEKGENFFKKRMDLLL